MLLEECLEDALLFEHVRDGTEGIPTVAVRLVERGQQRQPLAVDILQTEISVLLDPVREPDRVVREQALLKGLDVSLNVMLDEDNGDLKQPFGPDRQAVEHLEDVDRLV